MVPYEKGGKKPIIGRNAFYPPHPKQLSGTEGLSLSVCLIGLFLLFFPLGIQIKC